MEKKMENEMETGIIDPSTGTSCEAVNSYFFVSLSLSLALSAVVCYVPWLYVQD